MLVTDVKWLDFVVFMQSEYSLTELTWVLCLSEQKHHTEIIHNLLLFFILKL